MRRLVALWASVALSLLPALIAAPAASAAVECSLASQTQVGDTYTVRINQSTPCVFTVPSSANSGLSVVVVAGGGAGGSGIGAGGGDVEGGFQGPGEGEVFLEWFNEVWKRPPNEIEAVLAHELGHFKLNHVIKRIALMFVMSLAFLALLGWSIGDDNEFFSMDEMAKAFEVTRVSANPARFDLKKCTAINGDWIRAISEEDLNNRILPYLISDGFLPEVPTAAQKQVLAAAIPLVQSRMETLRQGAAMLGFLFAKDAGIDSDVTAGVASFKIDESEASNLNDETNSVLSAAATALEALEDWSTEAIEATLREALIDGLGLKPKFAFGPVRLATAGRRVSPPLFESLELLGRERSLSRVRSAIQG